MKKSIKIIFLIVLCFLLLSMYYIKMQNPFNSTETALIKSFNFSGAKIVSSEFYAWGKLENQNDSIDDLKRIVVEFSQDIGITNNSKLTSSVTDNDIMQRIELSGAIDDRKIANINVQLNIGPGVKKEKVLSVSVTEDLGSSSLEETSRIVLDAFKKYKIKPKINSCIIGSFAGKLDYNRIDNICKRIFDEVQAKRVEDMSDGNLMSVSAYSPFMGNSIKVNGKNVNLNLAIRYNSYENKTYIWLATPVITIEY